MTLCLRVGFKVTVTQEVGGSVNVFVHHAVNAVERHDAPELFQEFLQVGRGFCGALQVDGLRGIHQLDGKDAFYILHDLHGFDSGVAAHAHVVFLFIGRGNGINGAGSTQLFVFADNGSGGVLRNHEAGVQAGVGNEEFRDVAAVAGYQAVGAALGDAA